MRWVEEKSNRIWSVSTSALPLFTGNSWNEVPEGKISRGGGMLLEDLRACLNTINKKQINGIKFFEIYDSRLPEVNSIFLPKTIFSRVLHYITFLLNIPFKISSPSSFKTLL